MMKARFLVLALLVSAGQVSAHEGDDRDDGHRKWVASWATSPATFYTYVAPPQPFVLGPPIQYAAANIQPDLAFPFPNATTSGASAVDQTFRSLVKPDLWGRTLRIRFSNVFGNRTVTFKNVTVGLQEYGANIVKGTLTPVKFGGSSSVSIPAGERLFSDPIRVSWAGDSDDVGVAGRNLAISYAIQGDSGPMTYHSGANQTSFITAQGSGDHTWDVDGFAYEYTTTSWFFVETVDVRAEPDTVVICAFGDSITDGTHTTLNINDRWMNVLSRRLHNAYGNKISIVNEAIGGNRVVPPVVANAASGPAAVDRLDRDVLGLSGLTHVIWLEGINDLGGLHTTDSIIGGYEDVVQRLHAAGVKVYAATVTSALGVFGAPFPTGDNGPAVEAGRQILNSFIRHSGIFDGVEEFDAATLDPGTGNMKVVFLPNSQFTLLPWDYLHPNHAGYNAMGEVIDISPFKPRHGHHDH
jgi:lysophospholipase L1-like esterase